MLTVLTPPFPTRRPSDLALFAQALARLQPGGIVVASAANDAGAKSHEADLARIAGPLVSRSKHKCRVFWTQPGAGGGDATLATQWRTLAAPRPIADGRFTRRPGVDRQSTRMNSSHSSASRMPSST